MPAAAKYTRPQARKPLTRTIGAVSCVTRVKRAYRGSVAHLSCSSTGWQAFCCEHRHEQDFLWTLAQLLIGAADTFQNSDDAERTSHRRTRRWSGHLLEQTAVVPATSSRTESDTTSRWKARFFRLARVRITVFKHCVNIRGHFCLTSKMYGRDEWAACGEGGSAVFPVVVSLKYVNGYIK